MHTVDERTNRMLRSVLALAENRLRLDPVPLDRGTRSAQEMQELLDGLITEGVGSPTRCSASTPRSSPRR